MQIITTFGYKNAHLCLVIFDCEARDYIMIVTLIRINIWGQFSKWKTQKINSHSKSYEKTNSDQFLKAFLPPIIQNILFYTVS